MKKVEKVLLLNKEGKTVTTIEERDQIYERDTVTVKDPKGKIIGFHVGPKGEAFMTPRFDDNQFVYYVMDPLEQKHGKAMDYTSDTPANGTIVDGGDAKTCKYLPVLQKKHIKQIAASHGVSANNLTIVCQGQSPRLATEQLLEDKDGLPPPLYLRRWDAATHQCPFGAVACCLLPLLTCALLMTSFEFQSPYTETENVFPL